MGIGVDKLWLYSHVGASIEMWPRLRCLPRPARLDAVLVSGRNPVVRRRTSPATHGIQERRQEDDVDDGSEGIREIPRRQ